MCWLSNYVLERNRFAPETWCVVGNCYSLKQEHETALRYFGRALQINPGFSYAYTLSGHEHVANDGLEQGRRCYQKALNFEERQYNAWWGVGNVCLKQEKFEPAMQYFKTAIRINPRSSVLHTYMGMALHNDRKSADAIACFNRAEELDPQNVLNRF